MLEAVAGVAAALLVLVGLGIMAGPALPRALRLARTRLRGAARPPHSEPAGPVHPTTGRALSATARLVELLSDHGLRRHATALRLAGTRLRREEASGIYAMQDVLRHLRRVKLDDAQDQEIFHGLIVQVTRALHDRAEQLELLPRG